ncbi:MAG: DUF2946 family protein [Herbaspirillum sp.]
MDPIVKQAMAKWPNVPHCYGWLALDARGTWTMRNQQAQDLQTRGDVIRNPALLGFINRNYLHDELGNWYFQNGPQRVYVNLELTPYIVRSDPQQGYLLHTGAVLGEIDAVWLTEHGQAILCAGELVAALDDRDTTAFIDSLEIDGHSASDTQLLTWLQDPESAQLQLRHEGKFLSVRYVQSAALPTQFGFIRVPVAAVKD